MTREQLSPLDQSLESARKLSIEPSERPSFIVIGFEGGGDSGREETKNPAGTTQLLAVRENNILRSDPYADTTVRPAGVTVEEADDRYYFSYLTEPTVVTEPSFGVWLPRELSDFVSNIPDLVNEHTGKIVEFANANGEYKGWVASREEVDKLSSKIAESLASTYDSALRTLVDKGEMTRDEFKETKLLSWMGRMYRIGEEPFSTGDEYNRWSAREVARLGLAEGRSGEDIDWAITVYSPNNNWKGLQHLTNDEIREQFRNDVVLYIEQQLNVERFSGETNDMYLQRVVQNPVRVVENS